MVPNLLKYIGKANEANCKADAATILSQLQADYAAGQATEQTGVEALGTDYKVNNIPVTSSNATTLTPADNTALYRVVDGEITAFAYSNGKYVATWQVNTEENVKGSSWSVTKK